MVVIFWNFLIIHQNILLPKVEWSVIISNKNGTYMLPPKLLNEYGRFVGSIEIKLKLNSEN